LTKPAPLAMAVLALAVAAARGSADTPPNPAEVGIEDIAHQGSGCPANTVTINLAPDARAFTLIFDQFTVHTEPGAPPPESHKNCKIQLTIRVPRGFAYALTAVDSRGYANLAPGARGLVRTAFHFPGPEPDRTWRALTGPFNDDWQLREETDPGSLEWSPCNARRRLNLHTRLRVDRGSSAPGSSSLMAMDSLDGSVEQTYRLSWRRCAAP
jgi:hypothetical protein